MNTQTIFFIILEYDVVNLNKDYNYYYTYILPNLFR